MAKTNEHPIIKGLREANTKEIDKSIAEKEHLVTFENFDEQKIEINGEEHFFAFNSVFVDKETTYKDTEMLKSALPAINPGEVYASNEQDLVIVKGWSEEEALRELKDSNSKFPLQQRTTQVIHTLSSKSRSTLFLATKHNLSSEEKIKLGSAARRTLDEWVLNVSEDLPDTPVNTISKSLKPAVEAVNNNEDTYTFNGDFVLTVVNKEEGLVEIKDKNNKRAGVLVKLKVENGKLESTAEKMELVEKVDPDRNDYETLEKLKPEDQMTAKLVRSITFNPEREEEIRKEEENTENTSEASRESEESQEDEESGEESSVTTINDNNRGDIEERRRQREMNESEESPEVAEIRRKAAEATREFRKKISGLFMEAVEIEDLEERKKAVEIIYTLYGELIGGTSAEIMGSHMERMTQSMEELGSKVDALTGEVSRLREENRSMRKGMSDLKNENSQLRREISELRKDIGTSEIKQEARDEIDSIAGRRDKESRENSGTESDKELSGGEGTEEGAETEDLEIVRNNAMALIEQIRKKAKGDEEIKERLETLEQVLARAQSPEEVSAMESVIKVIGEGMYEKGTEETSLREEEKEEVIKERLEINSASMEQLMEVHGIGEKKAKDFFEKIQNYKRRNGRIKSLEELLNIKGIGPKTLEEIKKHFGAGIFENNLTNRTNTLLEKARETGNESIIGHLENIQKILNNPNRSFIAEDRRGLREALDGIEERLG